MSNIPWCDLKDNNILRLDDYSATAKCKCQKEFIFTPKQFQMEGSGFKNTMKELLKGPRKCGIILLNLD